MTEGILTIVLGVIVFFFLPDCKQISSSGTDRSLTYPWIVPATAKWLSDKERSFIQARLPGNSPRAKEKDFDWPEFK